MAGHFNNGWPPAPRTFPQEPQFSGFMSPVRFEGEIHNLEVLGSIPPEIDGTFYRVMPEPTFPAFVENDPVSVECFWNLYKRSSLGLCGLLNAYLYQIIQWFNGDGNISAFRVQGGHVDFKQKYVKTEKYLREAKARRALLGT